MISVGVDVSKGKSTICVLKPYGEIVCSPFEVLHVEKELEGLDNLLQKLDGEIRIVMEATGIYHLPILSFLQEKGYFVSVVNPYAMKKYAKDNSIRGAKTDRLDSVMIAHYGIEKWFKLQKYDSDEELYAELKLLGRRYRYYMELHVKALQELTHILDYVMPGIKKLFNSWDEASGKDKLSDFVERFWHFDLITSMSLDEFVDEYLIWAEEKKYHRSRSKAETVYELASGGISTLSSSTPSTKMLVQEAVTVLRAVDNSLSLILSRMQELAKSLPEYSTVRAMGGVGDVLAPKLIAEIGDVSRFTHREALTAFAGVDPGVNESGKFKSKSNKASKCGSARLRKTLFLIMSCLLQTQPIDDPVYCFLDKKRSEGKPYHVYMTAGSNKFLRIYYGKVKECLRAQAEADN